MWYQAKRFVADNALLLAISCSAGFLLGPLIVNYWPLVKAQFFSQDSLYQSTDTALTHAVETQQVQPVGWQALLPDAEKQTLNRYQNTPDATFTNQMLRSLQASTDQTYQSALYSTNIVEELIGKAVAVSGFVVPIEVGENRNITHFFLVPYYGACIHFPPPPPNQMIFVRLGEHFSIDNIETPVTVTGILQQGLFEDPLGTSAYMLKVSRIEAFYGRPDDFRRHEGSD